MNTSTGVGPLRTGSIFLLMAAVFTVSMGYGVVLPVLPFWLERISGGFPVPWHTGMLAGVYMLALFAFAPLWGRASDRFLGRRPVILLGLGGLVAALTLFGFTRNLGLGYLARALAGLFAGAVLPVTLAYVADTSQRERRARRFAWMSVASLLGFLAGPALSGWLSGVAMAMPTGAMVRRGAIWMPFLATGAIGAVVLLASWFRLPESAAPSPQREDEAQRENGGTLKALFLLSLLVFFGLGGFEVGITLLGQRNLGLDPSRIGIMFMECSLIMLLAQVLVFFSPLAGNAGGRLVVPAFLLMAVGLALLPAAAAFGVSLFWVGLVAAGSGILIPLLSYLVSLHGGASQGAALGRQTAATSLGQALGSAAAGWLFGTTAAAPFWLTSGLLLVGAVVGHGLGHEGQRP